MSIYNEEIEYKKFQSQKHKNLDKIVKKQLKTSGKFRIEKMGSGPGTWDPIPVTNQNINCQLCSHYHLSTIESQVAMNCFESLES